jgi:hypothetical protein
MSQALANNLCNGYAGTLHRASSVRRTTDDGAQRSARAASPSSLPRATRALAAKAPAAARPSSRLPSRRRAPLCVPARRRGAPPAETSCAPQVTAVGATYQIPEVGESWSGGGFSNMFPAPDYQKSAVQGYIAAHGGINAGKFSPVRARIPSFSHQKACVADS